LNKHGRLVLVAQEGVDDYHRSGQFWQDHHCKQAQARRRQGIFFVCLPTLLARLGFIEILTSTPPCPPHRQVNEVQATVGFSLETFTYGNFNFTLADMAGAQKFRNLWEKIYNDVQGIIFVIDSSDEFRMVSVKYELEQMLQHEGMIPSPCKRPPDVSSCHANFIFLFVLPQQFSMPTTPTQPLPRTRTFQFYFSPTRWTCQRLWAPLKFQID
jgi:GTPase SAR1 family protein